MNSLYFGTSRFLQQKYDRDQDAEEEMLNSKNKIMGFHYVNMKRHHRIANMKN